MIAVRRGESEGPWAWGALALTLFGLALLLMDAAFWHRGYAFGDETSKVAAFQRIIEGAPNWWALTQASVHRELVLLCMRAFPGEMLAFSLPAITAFALECCLIFLLVRRWGNSRAAFFAVAAVVFSAFTLVRGRGVLSFTIFPCEWLLLVLLRDACKKPWQQLIWGLLLGAFCHDYDGWLLTALALFVLPFPERRSFSALFFEALGFAAVLIALNGGGGLLAYAERRRTASFMVSETPTAGLTGLKELLLGGNPLPYMAPRDHPVMAFWFCLPFLLGVLSFCRRRPAILAFVALGFAAPLLGGAQYGVPCHRFIIGWPAICILVGLGVESAIVASNGRRWALLLVGAWVLVGASVELRAWQASQEKWDPFFRSSTRNLERAALAARARAKELSAPLVTELHPEFGAQVRYFSGQSAVPVTPTQGSIVAVLSWDYMPAVKKNLGEFQAFQEIEGYAPVFVGILKGQDALKASTVESTLRPLLSRFAEVEPSSVFAMQRWLEDNKNTFAWARNIVWDKALFDATVLAPVPYAWFDHVWRERMVTSRVYLHATRATKKADPKLAMRFIDAAIKVDPFSGTAWIFKEEVLRSMGREKEADQLHAKLPDLLPQGVWIIY